MALNVSLDVPFDDMQDWKDIRKKAEELNSTKACLINDETS
jgi:L-rhamnose isomerase